nr:PREDICTED: uncharacterized protein LOC107983754 [Anolis carolinensis]|eukprot:XP_016854212.1 PREDICTED: uncharacterized protein LOC107983754 [Anolis carolinensis]
MPGDFHIYGLCEDHVGTYQCKVGNNVGVAYCSVDIGFDRGFYYDWLVGGSVTICLLAAALIAGGSDVVLLLLPQPTLLSVRRRLLRERELLGLLLLFLLLRRSGHQAGVCADQGQRHLRGCRCSSEPALQPGLEPDGQPPLYTGIPVPDRPPTPRLQVSPSHRPGQDGQSSLSSRQRPGTLLSAQFGARAAHLQMARSVFPRR